MVIVVVFINLYLYMVMGNFNMVFRFWVFMWDCILFNQVIFNNFSNSGILSMVSNSSMFSIYFFNYYMGYFLFKIIILIMFCRFINYRYFMDFNYNIFMQVFFFMVWVI